MNENKIKSNVLFLSNTSNLFYLFLFVITKNNNFKILKFLNNFMYI